ncbi:MAG: Trypsin-like protein serine protease, contains C-terminal domain, Do-like protein [Bacillales bacterium]|jgi:serine protease Do|nr:Trypsin-like protein serine protease, contains C-terminal domain, Do-like protein [Bacillales bacterium]
MGYYDDFEEKSYRTEKKDNSSRTIFTSLISAIIGGLIIIVSIPVLAKFNLLPYDVKEKDPGVVEMVENEDGTKQRNVNVNVTTDITKAVDKVRDAVVGVINIQQGNMFVQDGEAGTGSGVIYQKSGDKAFIVTNNHVVEGASKVEVSLSDGRRISAKVLGTDIYTDLAVLEIQSKYVKSVADLGNSGSLKVGEPAVAIGNPLSLNFSGSVTQGIISGLERTVPVDLDGNGTYDWEVEVLQTDAAINPGNSGGALINIEGDVIGINSMKIRQEAVEGIGLAIPMDIAKPIISSLQKHGEVHRPYMGVELRSVGEIPEHNQRETLNLPMSVKDGIVIMSVIQGSPAEAAGIQKYDVVTKLDGKEVSNVIQLRKVLYQKEVGDSMEVEYYRGGKKLSTKMKLSKTQG